MAITTNVTKTFNDNTVQVEVSAGSAPLRYYKVQKQDADSFQREYKKGSNKMTWTTTALALLGGFAGMTPAYFLSKKWVGSNALRFVINVGLGFVGSMAGSYIGGKIGIKSHKALLEKYNAEEIEPPKTGLPI